MMVSASFDLRFTKLDFEFEILSHNRRRSRPIQILPSQICSPINLLKRRTNQKPKISYQLHSVAAFDMIDSLLGRG